MAVHQYIGARYVPGFKGTYSATTAYEALDVVDDGLGTSYIAKIPVPAGTPLNDPTYWMVYGSSNGAIINLQNRMTAVENDITNNIKPDITALERNILVIGNSYVGYGCADIIKGCFKNSYQHTKGGAGFLAYTGNTDDYEDAVDDAIADATIPKDSITDVLFISAMGDSRARYERTAAQFSSQLTTKLNSIMTKLKANYPNMKRAVVTLAETRDSAAFSNNKWNTVFQVHRAFKEICNECGYDYIGWSGWNTLFDSTYLQADHYHPSAAGAEVIGTWIRNAYFGKAEYKTFETVTNTANLNYGTPAATITILAEVTPDMAAVSIRRMNPTNGSAITLTAGDAVIETNGTNTIPIPPPMFATEVRTPIVASTTGNIVDMMHVQYNVDSDGKLFIEYRSNSSATVPGGALSALLLENITYKVS